MTPRFKEIKIAQGFRRTDVGDAIMPKVYGLTEDGLVYVWEGYNYGWRQLKEAGDR